MARRTREEIAAASKTYRVATNTVAKHLKVEPKHSRIPGEDFSRIAELIEPKSRERALKFYDLGVRRGLKQATDWFADGKVKRKGAAVVAPSKMTVRSKIRFSGEKWRPHKVVVETEDIGFE